LENDFYDFLDTFLFILQNQNGMSKKKYDIKDNNCHHAGIINTLLIDSRNLRNKIPTKEDFNNYLNFFPFQLEYYKNAIKQIF
jgi:hypothetical protein